ncbi:rac GTPase-activating protein 1 [Episyrphus balteatus]|uniref:rac GTPase-activating protein 1 n=1 Tax=Episyrphus balteatus TaxID=286459 RepID=UPI002486CAC4|nr:rac GTPase-activating protein 1 [Episyrphus balteatus]
MSALSTIAAFDDIRRCIHVLTDGTAEEEFLKVLKLQEAFRLECLSGTREAQRIQKELDASLQNMADLETKLFHARRLLEMESKARREAEHDRDQMEKKIIAVAELLRNERDINEETKDKLAFLNTFQQKKRKSLNTHIEEKFGNDINSTGSFLSDLSLTQSEDDFLDVRTSKNWQKHRPSLPKNTGPFVGGKRSRLSTGTPKAPTPQRRSGVNNANANKHTLEIGANEKICATTKVSIPQDGSGTIRAESTIEAIPITVDEQQHHHHRQQEEVVISSPQSKMPRPSNNCTPMRPSPHKENPVTLSVNPFPPASPAVKHRSMMRQHNFSSKTFIRTDTCTHCQKKIRFGSVALKCRDCQLCCHVDCRGLLTVTCVPQSGTPTLKGLMGYISDHAPPISPMIPALIVHCVFEIENRGLNEVGIYRVSGSEREVKALKERFLRGKGKPHLADIDVHVLCGCIKDFLRSLREPLIPTGLWKDFCNAVQDVTENDIQRNLYNAINQMPQANRDTLAFLILHFQRIAECPEVRMPIENISRVFGPTIVGYSSPDPDQHAIFTEIHMQFSVMQNLMKIPSGYWTQYVDFDKENTRTNNGSSEPQTPVNNKETFYSLYATPLKSTLKKRKFYATPPYSHKKK